MEIVMEEVFAGFNSQMHQFCLVSNQLLLIFYVILEVLMKFLYDALLLRWEGLSCTTLNFHMFFCCSK